MTTLNLADIFFMRAVLPLSEAHRELLNRLVTKGRRSIPDEVSHELSNLCGSRLVTHGFDDYNSPTVEGRKLKELLDKLYT